MLHGTPSLKETPSQTAGPYVHIGMTPNFCDIRGVYPADLGAVMISDDTPGERIEIAGRLIDGDGAPVFDALLEIWQADASGAYLDPRRLGLGAFSGWGRQAMDETGGFSFKTIKPGRVPGPDGKPMAHHVSLWIVARGINTGLQTRLYFDDEADANATDWVLNRIPSPARRRTLIARKEAGAIPRYVLDLRLQGENETVFFDL
ncbi:MAG: protocatechuate 3,4-dioxygenase subunit alpha [Reyranella sp.]|nr:protocatechuate 3,4-dioxygenase subunit alpha [Reyranella sp.]